MASSAGVLQRAVNANPLVPNQQTLPNTLSFGCGCETIRKGAVESCRPFLVVRERDPLSPLHLPVLMADGSGRWHGGVGRRGGEERKEEKGTWEWSEQQAR